MTLSRPSHTLTIRLAAFSAERFAAEYAAKALSHLISVLKHQPERGAAFAAIADMAVALESTGEVCSESHATPWRKHWQGWPGGW